MAAILIGPTLVDLLDRHRVQIEPAGAAILLTDNQICAFEHANMRHDRDTSHIEIARKLADSQTGIIAQMIKDRPARSVRKGMKDLIRIAFGKHVITYLHITIRVKPRVACAYKKPAESAVLSAGFVVSVKGAFKRACLTMALRQMRLR